MKARIKLIPYLIISILSAVGILLFINTYPPQIPIDFFGSKVDPSIPLFMLILALLSCLFAFILNHSRRGIFIGIFASLFMILIYLDINNIFNTAILIMIFVLSEILFKKK